MNRAVNETWGVGESATLVVFVETGGSYQSRVKVLEWKVTRPLGSTDCRRLAKLFNAAADIADGKDEPKEEA